MLPMRVTCSIMRKVSQEDFIHVMIEDVDVQLSNWEV